jgi:hypothetical protein
LYRSINIRSQSSAIAVPDPEIDWTLLLENELAKLARKSPLAIESIDDRYFRSLRGVMRLHR